MKEYLATIKNYLAGKISFEDFEDGFYMQYMDSDENFPDYVDDIFQEICELMDFTSSEKLSLEEQNDGWIKEGDFKKKLKIIMNNFKR